jgi:hypothetical protein
MTYQMKERLQGGICCGRLYEYGPCYDHKNSENTYNKRNRVQTTTLRECASLRNRTHIHAFPAPRSMSHPYLDNVWQVGSAACVAFGLTRTGASLPSSTGVGRRLSAVFQGDGGIGGTGYHQFQIRESIQCGKQ